MAVVFDTNVLISAAFFARSKPSFAVRWAAQHDVILLSAVTLTELASTIGRSKFDRYASLDSRREFVAFVSSIGHFVTIRRTVRACRDVEDDKFLDVAINGTARFVVTGDADLLSLGSFEAIPIISPADYIARVEC